MPASNVLWPVPLQRLTPFYPGQLGVPGTDSDRGLRENSTGKVIWVDPNFPGASDQRDGTNPDDPMLTVGAALTKCRAYSGDVIAVMHNGRWTYGDATEIRRLPIQEAVIVTVPGIRIVGISPSPLGVTWMPPGDSAACITIRELDVIVEGFNFYNPAYATTTGVLAEWAGGGPAYYGDNVIVRHCNFYDLSYGVSLDYAWYSHVEDCRFESIADGAIHNPSVYGEPDYSTFKGNVFVACGNAINLNSGCSEILIEGNRFVNNTLAITMLNGAHNNTIHSNTIQGAPAGTNNMINLTGATATNLVSDNWLSCSIAQYDVTCSDATSGAWVNNHCTNGDTTAPPV